MTDGAEFRELMGRLRVGDEEAASRLVREYGPVIRSVIRVRLRGSPHRRHFDSMDVYQTVLYKFFNRAAAGKFAIDHPRQLVRLLTTMTQNAFVDRVRREQAGIRRLINAGDEALEAAVDPHHDARASAVVPRNELAERARGLMSESVRGLAGPWAEGRTWPEIAAAEGGTPDALRVKFSRALDRVREQLGRDSVGDGW